MAELCNEIVLTAHPSDELVKLLCWNTDCRLNLKNAVNTPKDESFCCGLKYITIDKFGKCVCYQSLTD